MLRNRLVQLACLIVGAAALLAAGAIHQPFDRLRDDMDRQSGEELTQDDAAVKAIQFIPGGLRALAVDFLWIRSEQMKQEGKYYDADQMAESICKLQPRFPEVWLNRSWNLAYNMSHMAHTGPERWSWVSRGIELLRNKGLRLNPKSLPLHKELAWIFQHKIGEAMDDMHNDFKGYHAGEFHRVLGAPPRLGDPDFDLAVKAGEAAEKDAPLAEDEIAANEDDPLVKAYIAWMQPIVDAPDTVGELRADEAADAFVDRLETLGAPLGLKTLDAYNAWSDDLRVRMRGQPVVEPADTTQLELRKLMTAPAAAAARDKVVAFCRKKVLRERYNMKPWWMARIIRKYGPLDWRLCWPHCLYWASYGLYNCKGYDVEEINALNAGRLVLNPLKSLVSYGQAALVYNPENPIRPVILTQANWRFIDAAEQAHWQLTEYYTGAKKDDTYLRFQAGHENFLKASIHTLFCAGQMAKADKYLRKARKLYHMRNEPLYGLDLEQFVYQSLNPQGVPRRQDMAQLVDAQARRAWRYLVMGDNASYQLYIRQAYWFWKKWDDEIQSDPRKALAPFPFIQNLAAARAMEKMPLEAQILFWPYVPVEVQQGLYEPIIVAQLKPACEKKNIDFEKAFPAPPGLDDFRKRREEMVRRNQNAAFNREETHEK